VALVLALGLAIAVILVAATIGLGRPGVPSGAVAIVDGVDNGTVSDADYQRGIEQASARLGLDQPPEPGSPEFQQVNDEAMQDLLLAIWAEGEAADRGIEVTDQDVQDELDQVQAGFENEREFARVVRQSRFCSEEEIAADTPPAECADVVEQGRLLALQRKLSEDFATEPNVTDADIERFYDANQESLQTPATRSVRVILNEDEARVEAARAELDGLSPDDSGFAKAWESAARKYSQDQASKDRGGLLEGLVQGQGDPQLDEQVFNAAEGELVGPFETDRGFYLIEVVDSTPASTQSLEEASPTIEQQLVAARQQADQAEVQNDFLNKWTRSTQCIEEVEMQFCAGYVAPEPEPIAGQPAPPEPAPVNPTSPIEPGTSTLSIDGSTQTGLPQGPKVPAPDTPEAATGLPPGAVPVGPDGAPVAPGGAQGAPPGGAQGAPPPAPAPAP
jgi:parvulin-like peptidyl-prolyl isomerase